MFNFFLKNKFIYLFGLTTFNSFLISESFLKADNLTIKKSIDSTYISKKETRVSPPEFRLVRNNFNNYLNNNLKNYENIVTNFLTKNPENLEIKEVDIQSNILYEKDNIFYAEGDVILYLSNAELKGDRITFNRDTKEFVAEGNVSFEKGNQYFEALKLVYNLKNGKGYLNEVYGVIDVINFAEDIELNYLNNERDKKKLNENNKIRDLAYISTATIGLENDFEEDKRLNISDLNFEIPSINKWRFKSKKITINSKSISSDKIYFSNDPFNKPQFIIISKKFSGEIIEDKVKFVGRNNWVTLDDKVSFPIGRWTIFDRDPISKWTIGSDYEERDGFYISRSFEEVEIFDKFKLQLTPHYLIQRSLKGNSNSFREPNSSILSNKIKNKTSFSDYFALDADIRSESKDWKLEMINSFNTLNGKRFSEALRSKLTLTRSFDLNQSNNNRDSGEVVNSNKSSSNFADIQFYSVFREKVSKGYEGDEEIYFGNGLSLANKNSSTFNDVFRSSAFIFNSGEYKAKRNNKNELHTSLRNVLAFSYDYKFPLWIKKDNNEEITKEYKFTPKIIKPSIYWSTNIDSGVFFYNDNKNQKAISFNTGPIIVLGSLKKNYLDYSKISTKFTYVKKSGSSPFAFDDINDDTRLGISFEQQIYGPLVFSYSASMPLNTTNIDHGKILDSNYKLDFKRRAYGVSAYYNTTKEIFGIQFQINNFNYGGISKPF